MSHFTMDVHVARTLIARGSSPSVVSCAEAWLEAFAHAHDQGVERKRALLAASEAWDNAASRWRPGDGAQGRSSPHPEEARSVETQPAVPPRRSTCETSNAPREARMNHNLQPAELFVGDSPDSADELASGHHLA